MNTLTVYSQPDPLAVIAGAALAESTKRKYSRTLARYLEAGGDLFDAEQLAAYASGLSNSGRAFLKAALRLVTDQVVNDAKGAATPENALAVQAIAYRVQALQSAVRVQAVKGTKVHTWLSAVEVKALLDTCGDDLVGQRDRLALGLMVCAGLRRAEAVALTFADVQLLPIRDRLRTVLSIEGKGSKFRTVPISDALANAIDRWGQVVGHEGRILRSFDQGRRLRAGGLSAVAVFRIVRKHGSLIGKPELSPHDLRRTFAQLGYEAGLPVTQISVLLGHSNVATTQRYLNLALDLEVSISDFIPFPA